MALAIQTDQSVERVGRTLPLCPRGCESSTQTIWRESSPSNQLSRIIACDHCGWRFTYPPAEGQQDSDLYDDSYAPYQKRLKHHWGEAWTAWLARRRMAWLARLLCTSRFPLPFGAGRSLEIGCGAGGDLRRMMDLGWHATGIEPNQVAAERAVRWSGAEVMVDHFPSKRLASESFDLISSQQVLEHLPSPAEAGREMARLLAPGGRLFISVPNSGGWSARQFGTGWIGWDVPRHQTHFTERSLARWAIDAGLQVESIRAKPHVSWIQQSARRSPPGWVNQWARTRWGASMLARFTGWIGQGDSLLLWARKPSKGSKSG